MHIRERSLDSAEIVASDIDHLQVVAETAAVLVAARVAAVAVYPLFRSLLISRIILSFLFRRPFIIAIGRSRTLLPGTLIAGIVIVLVLRRAWSPSLSRIWSFLIVLLIVAAIPRLLRVLVVLLLILIPIAGLCRSLSLRLAVVRSPRRFVRGVRVVCHSCTLL